MSISRRSLAWPSVCRFCPVVASLNCTSGLGQNRIATNDPSGERARDTGGSLIFHVFSPPAPWRIKSWSVAKPIRPSLEKTAWVARSGAMNCPVSLPVAQSQTRTGSPWAYVYSDLPSADRARVETGHRCPLSVPGISRARIGLELACRFAAQATDQLLAVGRESEGRTHPDARRVNNIPQSELGLGRRTERIGQLARCQVP